MGEVDFTLDLPNQELVQRLTLPLTANYEKARRRVRGELTFEYTWKPAAKCSDDALLCGTLEVTVLNGEDLISIDWKGSCCSDPYVIVITYPQSPGELDGRVKPCWYRTETAPDTSNPRWDSKVTFDVNWTEAGSAQCMKADMTSLGSDGAAEEAGLSPNGRMGGTRKSVAVNGLADQQERKRTASNPKTPEQLMPELQAEINQLKNRVVPKLQGEMREIREDLSRIIEALRRTQNSDRKIDAKKRQEELSTSSTNPLVGLISAMPEQM
jgi:hypothetical protein